MLATASLSGVLGIWDLSSYRLRQQCKHPVSMIDYYFMGLAHHLSNATMIEKSTQFKLCQF